MANLATTYMGIRLRNPVIVGACGLTSNLDIMQRLQGAGAGAVICKSLYEEQVTLENLKMHADLHKEDNRYAEMLTVFPELEYVGPKEHLYWVKKTKAALSIPVFVSLNAVIKNTWLEYAEALADTGADGLELNFYANPRNPADSPESIEKEQLDIVSMIRKKISLPMSVKLSSHYSNILRFVRQLIDAGADGFVLFNRYFQPDIDINSEKPIFPLTFSRKIDNRLPLRFTGLLADNIKADICSSTGIMDAEDAIKMILAGASCIQIVSTIYENSMTIIEAILKGLDVWMVQKGYPDLAAFRSKLSQKNIAEPWVYTRTQYIKLLMQSTKELMSRIYK